MIGGVAGSPFFKTGCVVFKEKNMKRNLTVLVLLVTWSLMSIPMLSFAANDNGVPDVPESSGGSSSQDLIVRVTGAADDDNGGDPGDAGDGYGFTDPDLIGEITGESDGVDTSIIDEYLLFIMSLIQLAL
jgi:hypothetical protein